VAQSSLSPRVARVLERAFELTSVVPLGAFVVIHLVEYGRVLTGAAVVGARRFPPPALIALELVLVWAPLAFHVVFGAVVWRQRRKVPDPDPPGGVGLLVLNRLSALLSLAFLVHHVVRFRLPILRGQVYPADSLQRLAAELSATRAGMPLVAALELAGVLAVSYHFAYGLFRLGARHSFDGIRLRIACTGTGAILGLLGAATVIRLAGG